MRKTVVYLPAEVNLSGQVNSYPSAHVTAVSVYIMNGSKLRLSEPCGTVTFEVF